MKSQAYLTMIQGELPLAEARNLHEYLEMHQTDEGFQALSPCQPTTVMPGPEKAELMRQRLEAGQELWHPSDPRVKTTRYAADLIPIFSNNGDDDDTD